MRRPSTKPQRQRAAPKDDFDVALDVLRDEIEYLNGALTDELKISVGVRITAKRDALERALHEFADFAKTAREG